MAGSGDDIDDGDDETLPKISFSYYQWSDCTICFALYKAFAEKCTMNQILQSYNFYFGNIDLTAI